jgi:predicted 2-oxoglutarate/Fe(II)-dependent dioxygenase YbiX
MNKKNILPGLTAYLNVDLTAEDVLEWTKEDGWIPGEVSDGNVASVIKETRNCSVKPLLSYLNKIDLVVSKYLKDYATEHNLSDLKIDHYKFVRYTEGQFFSEHSDGGQGHPRRVSMVLYLNDEYSGGEISFTKFDVKLSPKAQTLILFPSTGEYSHAALPVKSGIKYIVTGFWN